MNFQEGDFQDFDGEGSVASINSQNYYVSSRNKKLANLNESLNTSNILDAQHGRQSNQDKNRPHLQQQYYTSQSSRSPSKSQLNYQKQDSRTMMNTSHINSPQHSQIMMNNSFNNFCAMSMQSLESAMFNAQFADENRLPYQFSAFGFVDLQNLYKDWIVSQYQQQKQARERYSDSIFVADSHALVNNLKRSPYLSWTTEITWKRFKDFFPRTKFELVRRPSGNNNKSNVNNNNNGTTIYSTVSKLCNSDNEQFAYLVMAMNILRDKPVLLDRIFEGQSLNDVGLYYVRLCVDGVWKYIAVDDYFPCSKKSTKLGGARLDPSFVELSTVVASSSTPNALAATNNPANVTHEIWPLLLMKAYAKYLGTYESMLQGNLQDTLRDFTGAAFDRLTTRDENLASQLKFALDKKYILLSTVYLDLNEKQLRGFGGAEYAAQVNLTSVQFELTNILVLSGNKPIVEIKDVLGQVIWKGEKDLFSGYAASDLDAMQIGKKANGTFYMSLSDFIECFSDITVCKVSTGTGSNFFYSACAVRHAVGGYATRKLRALSSGICDIELVQKDWRLSRESAESYLTSQMLVLTRNDEDSDSWEALETYETSNGILVNPNSKCSSGFVVELMQGKEYFVICSLDYDLVSRKVIDSVVSCSGSEALTEWVEFDVKRDGDVFEQFLRNKCMKQQNNAQQSPLNTRNKYKNSTAGVVATASPAWKQLNAHTKMSCFDAHANLGIGFVACTFENTNAHEAVEVEGIDKLAFAEFASSEGSDRELHRVEKTGRKQKNATSIGEDDVLILDPLATCTFIWKINNVYSE